MKLDRPASDGAGKRVASRKRRTKMAALEARLLQCRWTRRRSLLSQTTNEILVFFSIVFT